MSAYRPLGPFPQFLLADGTVNNGGLIHFYETDLTTLQDTWSDVGLTTLNANPVVLDASGRPTTDIWGSAAYGVVITDSLGANPRTFNNIQPDVGTGATIPSLVSGDFLTNNGSVLLWEAISQLPDPTGHAGQILFTDGTLDYWGAVPTPTAVTVTSSSIVIGSVTIQWGAGVLPASGTTTATTTVTFPVSFSGLPYAINVTASTGSGAFSGGGQLIISAEGQAASAFIAQADGNTGFASGAPPIIRATNFSWIAVGPT